MVYFVDVEMTNAGVHHIDSHKNDKSFLIYLKMQAFVAGLFRFSVQW